LSRKTGSKKGTQGGHTATREENQGDGSRAALGLFTVCIAVLVAIFILNRALVERREHATRAAAWFTTVSSMLGRVRAFRSRNADFFSGITLSALCDDFSGPYAKLVPSIDETNFLEFYAATGTRHTLDEGVGTLADELVKFGAAVAAIEGDRPGTDTLARLNGAVAGIFHNRADQKYIAKTVVPLLVTLDDPGRRMEIMDWVATGRWPPLGGTSNPYYPSSVLRRFPREWTVREEAAYMQNRLLMCADFGVAETTLRAAWEDGLKEMREAATEVPKVELMGVGLVSRADDLLLFAGLVIASLLLVVFVHWERLRGTSRSYCFPQFGSPDDPMKPTGCLTAEGLASRGLFATFLAMPVLILAVGTLTRYDLTTAGFRPFFFRWNHITGYGMSMFRPHDSVSEALDVVDLLCLGICLLAVMGMTRAMPGDRASLLKEHAGLVRVLCRAAVVVFGIWFTCLLIFLVRASVLGIGPGLSDLVLLILFCVCVILAFLWALRGVSFFGMALAVGVASLALPWIFQSSLVYQLGGWKLSRDLTAARLPVRNRAAASRKTSAKARYPSIEFAADLAARGAEERTFNVGSYRIQADK